MSLLVSGADPLVVESTPAYHVWCHLFSCTKGGAEAGRAFPNFRFGRLVVELLLTSFVKWLHDMRSVVSENLAMTYHLWFEGFLLTNFWNMLDISPALSLMSFFTVLYLGCCCALVCLVLKPHFTYQEYCD